MKVFVHTARVQRSGGHNFHLSVRPGRPAASRQHDSDAVNAVPATPGAVDRDQCVRPAAPVRNTRAMTARSKLRGQKKEAASESFCPLRVSW